MSDTKYNKVKCLKLVTSYPDYYVVGETYQACGAGSGGQSARYWVGIPGKDGHHVSITEFKNCFT